MFRQTETSSGLIGVYGGTFDPIHFAHLRTALDVQIRLNLDEIRFVPCYQPVHRSSPSVSAQQRSDMIALAIAQRADFILDRREIKRQGPSYMVDTLASMQQELNLKAQGRGLVLIMGTDAFNRFLHWYDWSGILNLANIAVMHRPQDQLSQQSDYQQLLEQRRVEHLDQLNGQIIEVDVTQFAISATQIRRLIYDQQPVDYLMPDAVVNYIQSHKLYQ